MGITTRLRGTDAWLAAATFLFTAAVTLAVAQKDDTRPIPFAGWVLMLAACAALAVRRRYPVPVALFTLVACGLFYPLVEPDGPMMMTFIIALYTLAALGRLVWASVLGAVAMSLTGYGEFETGSHLQDAGLYLLAGWFVAVIAVGGVVHNRRAYLREAEKRAEAAEHGREEEARRRATEERLRIARELHDVLGHNISLINVQATAALHGGDTVQAEDALAAIKQASKETLRELRTTLGVLRQVDEDAPTEPPPGLARLGELTARTEATGVLVHTKVKGTGTLPPETDLAAFRIIQEALTNVARHSDATTVTIAVTHEPETLTVEITDNGHPTETTLPSSGTGLIGMRERAETLGGSLTAAPIAPTGFRVQAVLPVG
ncbi:sensor histidine kinase [Spirillospora sp. CA-294931]|uniref:sensor histidine kinase n=1 Tax=Spirillospora sp. CA-294931 TaxID=3240042 RepID=UPI003D8E6059